jgi:hypothetical protein
MASASVRCCAETINISFFRFPVDASAFNFWHVQVPTASMLCTILNQHAMVHTSIKRRLSGNKPLNMCRTNVDFPAGPGQTRQDKHLKHTQSHTLQTRTLSDQLRVDTNITQQTSVHLGPQMHHKCKRQKSQMQLDPPQDRQRSPKLPKTSGNTCRKLARSATGGHSLLHPLPMSLCSSWRLVGVQPQIVAAVKTAIPVLVLLSFSENSCEFLQWR